MSNYYTNPFLQNTNRPNNTVHSSTLMNVVPYTTNGIANDYISQDKIKIKKMESFATNHQKNAYSYGYGNFSNYLREIEKNQLSKEDLSHALLYKKPYIQDDKGQMKIAHSINILPLYMPFSIDELRMLSAMGERNEKMDINKYKNWFERVQKGKEEVYKNSQNTNYGCFDKEERQLYEKWSREKYYNENTFTAMNSQIEEKKRNNIFTSALYNPFISTSTSMNHFPTNSFNTTSNENPFNSTQHNNNPFNLQSNNNNPFDQNCVQAKNNTSCNNLFQISNGNNTNINNPFNFNTQLNTNQNPFQLPQSNPKLTNITTCFSQTNANPFNINQQSINTGNPFNVNQQQNNNQLNKGNSNYNVLNGNIQNNVNTTQANNPFVIQTKTNILLNNNNTNTNTNTNWPSLISIPQHNINPIFYPSPFSTNSHNYSQPINNSLINPFISNLQQISTSNSFKIKQETNTITSMNKIKDFDKILKEAYNLFSEPYITIIQKEKEEKNYAQFHYRTNYDNDLYSDYYSEIEIPPSFKKHSLIKQTKKIPTPTPTTLIINNKIKHNSKTTINQSNTSNFLNESSIIDTSIVIKSKQGLSGIKDISSSNKKHINDKLKSSPKRNASFVYKSNRFKITPDYDTLINMSYEELSSINSFSIIDPFNGIIQFNEPVDITNVNFDKEIGIDHTKKAFVINNKKIQNKRLTVKFYNIIIKDINEDNYKKEIIDHCINKLKVRLIYFIFSQLTLLIVKRITH